MEERNNLFPIFLKLRNIDTLLIGAGNVGLEKLEALLKNDLRVRESLQYGMQLKDLFEFPTIRTFANQCISRSGPGKQQEITVVAPQADYPVSPGQQRLFVLQKLNPESVAYNMAGAFVIDVEL